MSKIYPLTINVAALDAGQSMTITLDSGSTWALGLRAKPSDPSAPMSIALLDVTASTLQITAGTSPFSGKLNVNIDGGQFVSGKTSSASAGYHVTASVDMDSSTDLMDEWTIKFDN